MDWVSMTLMLAVMKSEPTLRGACSQDRQGSQAGLSSEERLQAAQSDQSGDGLEYTLAFAGSEVS